VGRRRRERREREGGGVRAGERQGPPRAVRSDQRVAVPRVAARGGGARGAGAAARVHCTQESDEGGARRAGRCPRALPGALGLYATELGRVEAGVVVRESPRR